MNPTSTNPQTQRTNLKYFQEDYLTTWIEAFLIDRKAQNLAKGTVKFYSQKLEDFSKYCDSQLIKTIPQITPEVIRNFLFYLKKKGHSDGGIHCGYRSLKVFLRWYENEAEPEGWKNPICKVKAPKVAEQILKPVELDIVFSLINICEKGTFTGDRDRAAYLTLLDTGCRASEFLSIRLEDMDIINGCILIRLGKGRKSRIVGICSKTKKAIRIYLKHRSDNLPFLWIRDDLTDRLTYDGLRAIVTRRSKQLKINPPSLHSFRRAFSINFLRNGGDLISLSKILGHSSLACVQKYLKLLPEDLLISHKKYSPVENSNL